MASESSGLVPLGDAPVGSTGGKGASLQWLAAHGYLIPETWVLPPTVQPDLAGLDTDRPYAVRSSANVEDGDDASYAGQFETQLGVVGRDDVLTAIDAVRASVSLELTVFWANRAADPSLPISN